MLDSSRGRRLPMSLMLLAIVVAMAVVAIGVALGGGGMAMAASGTDATIEATPFSVEPSKIGEAFAVCPGQQRALGGGVIPTGFGGQVAASGPLAETKDVANTVSGDIAKRWYAAEVNGSGEKLSVRVFAICSATSDATIEAAPFTVEGAAPGPVTNSKTGEAYAVCPSDKRALGGGVVQGGPPNALYVRASGPLAETKDAANTVSGDIAKRWYAAVANYSKEPVNLKVFAICSATSDASIVASAFEVAGMQNREAYAVCPSDKRALGGGVVQSGPPDNLLVYASGSLAETKDAANTVSGDVAKRWYARVDNSSGAPVNLKVFAICSSAPQGPSPGPTPPPNVKAAKVMSTVPKANATGVAPAANIKVTFSKAMKSSSINANTFKLFTKGSTTKLTAKVTYDASTHTATLDPANSLRSGRTYKAVVTMGAKDLAGNSLDQNPSVAGEQQKAWLFTTIRK
jgi:hypothetical protein